MYRRSLHTNILHSLQPNFVVILYGARRTGKTFLMQTIRKELGVNNVLHFTGDDLEASELLSSQKLSTLERLVKGYKYLFIDEAQMIPNIASSLKLMVDNIEGLHVFITGSSSLDLKGKMGEPLTGRSIYYSLHPLAQSEIGEDFAQMRKSLEDRLIYGSYPQVVSSVTQKARIEQLQSILNGYQLKDLLMLDNVKDSLFVLDLLRLLAFQIGHDVSLSELAQNLQVHVQTVKRYLDLLEKTFVLFSIRSFSRNLRKEISKSPRYYFWDMGIRNVVISSFNRLTSRNDLGQLWENYCISERMKHLGYTQSHAASYFWRTYDQQEIDLIEEMDGQLSAFEFKWKTKAARVPKAFEKAYTNFSFETIHRENYYDFIGA